MDTDKIREFLASKAEKHGELKNFCKQIDVPYWTVWRIAKKKTSKIDHDLAIKLSSAIPGNQQQSKGELHVQ